MKNTLLFGALLAGFLSALSPTSDAHGGTYRGPGDTVPGGGGGGGGGGAGPTTGNPSGPRTGHPSGPPGGAPRVRAACRRAVRADVLPVRRRARRTRAV